MAFQPQTFPIECTATESVHDKTSPQTFFINQHGQRSAFFEGIKHIVDATESFSHEIMNLQTTKRQCNSIMSLTANLFRTIFQTQKLFLGGHDPEEKIEIMTDNICATLQKFRSTEQRQQYFSQNSAYVAPDVYALGLRWESRPMKMRGQILRIPRLIQNTLYSVSIIETLRVLFSNSEFRRVYLDYNTRLDHTCSGGTYVNFCCGKFYRGSTFFQSNPNALQLQIALDECEICNPLGSKAGQHKILPVYLTIRNLPPKFLSRNANTYLIALCNANDLRTGHTDYNNIWNILVPSIQYLETQGIDIDEHTNIKGTLIAMCGDNAGANSAQGFVGSFVSHFFCRHCTMSKDECKISSKLNKSTKRTVEGYDESLKIIDDSEKVNFSDTKGIKYACNLNNLANFHIISNPSVDIMHDVLEGTAAFALKKFIDFGVTNKIFTLDEVVSSAQFFNYGRLNVANTPSAISLDKKNLGQSAAQMKCLVETLPYIIYTKKDHPLIVTVWPCLQSLLIIMEIIFSEQIAESDIDVLESALDIHMTALMNKFNITLIPKHHFMLHYPDIIREMGPLVRFSMLPYENKHQQLKSFMKSSRNFKNPNKSIVSRHQEWLCMRQNQFTYADNIECGKHRKHDAANGFWEVSWLNINNYKYRPGFLILHERQLFEIHKILYNDSRYSLLCHKCDVLTFDEFLNSFEIKRIVSADTQLLEISILTDHKPYEALPIDGRLYVKCGTLQFKKTFPLFQMNVMSM